MATQSKEASPRHSAEKVVGAAAAEPQEVDPDDAAAALELAFQDPVAEDFPGLRLNLGLPRLCISSVVTLKRTWTNAVIAFILTLMMPLELALGWFIRVVPPRIMYVICTSVFKVLVWCWALLPRSVRLRGVGDEMSTEAHLLSMLMWPMRLLPISTRRMRLAMSACTWMAPPRPGIKEEVINVPEAGVKGLWLHTAPLDVEDPPVLMWIFGGAFFAGDCEGNRGLAATYAEAIGADVFLVDYRLLPEHTLEDCQQDGCRGYEWLCTQKAPSKIFAGGVSAGAGILLRALQATASTDAEERRWAFHGEGPTEQPAAAMFLGPFVDYTIPRSLAKNSAVDWIVTQQVLRYGAPIYVKRAGGKQSRLRELSPLYRPVQGLCPIFISYSLHEGVTDQCDALVSKLRAAGNDVEAQTESYLGHVFQVMPAFLPEARKAEVIALSWLQGKKEASLCKAKITRPRVPSLEDILQGTAEKGQGFFGG